MNHHATILLSSALALLPGTQEEGPAQGRRSKNLVPLPDDYVRFARLPGGGQQPRLAFAADGTPHVLFFRGEGETGDLFLCRTSDEAESFTDAVQVNSSAGAVGAPEGKHGAAIALGPDGRIHVVWTDRGQSLRYARSEPEGKSFEPERELLPKERIGRSAALAVDQSSVFIFYGALDREVEEGDEPQASPWLLRSRDGGETFEEARTVGEKNGMSLDSGLTAHIDADGTLYALYRSAGKLRNEEVKARARDTRLLHSEDSGDTFRSVLVGNWKLTRDPRTPAPDLFLGPHRMLAAWEASDQVFWSFINRETHKSAMPIEPRRGRDAFSRWQPCIAANKKSEVLLAWLEQPVDSPDSDPQVSWQVWEIKTNAPVGNGIAPVPAGKSSPVVLPRSDGGFTVIY